MRLDGHGLFKLLAGVCLFVFLVSPLMAELEIDGMKTFEFRDYGVRGDLSQFMHENPLFLGDRGFDQSLRLEISGTIGDRVHVDVCLDDSLDDEEDKKLLVSIDGRVWDITLGRLNFDLPDRQFLLSNRTVLGMKIEGHAREHHFLFMAGRPEGRSERNFFQGQGSMQEYVLRDSDGVLNPQVVQGSEIVEIDGRRLKRGADYDIDYEEGCIVFDSSLLPIEETSRISVRFETMASGGTFQSTILGFRHEMDIGASRRRSRMTTHPAVDKERRTYVAYSIIRDADDHSAGVSERTSATPRELTVLGIDGAVALPGGLRLELECASSRLDPDTMDPDNPVTDGGALEARLSRSTGRNDLELSHKVVEPGFNAVGKEGFARLASDSDLVSDVRATTFRNRLEVGDSVTVSNEFNKSRTNLADDPDRDTVDFQRQEHGLSWRGPGERALDASFLNERSSGEDDVTSKSRTSASARLPVGPVVLSTRLSTEDNNAQQARTEDYSSAELGVASRSRNGAVDWNCEFNVQEVDVDEEMERARLNTQATLNLGLHPGRKLSTDLTLSKRIERNFNELDDEHPRRLDIDTGEGKIRWQPRRSLSLNLKGSVEQRSRILAVTDDRDVAVASTRDEETTSATIVTENPVLTLVTSDSLEWKPSKRWNHRLQFRERQERDAVTGERFSLNRAVDCRSKYAPSRKLRFTADAMDGRSNSTTAGTARDTFEAGGEILYNFNNGLSTVIQSRYSDVDDRKDDNYDEKTWTRGISLERRMGDTIKARGGFKRIRKVSNATSLERALDLGVTCTPKRSKLRWELGLKNGVIEGVDTGGARFDSFNRKLSLKVDGRIGRDTRLESALNLISAGPDGKGGDGYRATTTEMKVSIDF